MKVLDGINVYTNVFWAATKNNQFLPLLTHTLSLSLSLPGLLSTVHKLYIFICEVFFLPDSFLLNSFFGSNEKKNFADLYMLSGVLAYRL